MKAFAVSFTDVRRMTFAPSAVTMPFALMTSLLVVRPAHAALVARSRRRGSRR
jgi:hypothetical protein